MNEDKEHSIKDKKIYPWEDSWKDVKEFLKQNKPNKKFITFKDIEIQINEEYEKTKIEFNQEIAVLIKNALKSKHKTVSFETFSLESKNIEFPTSNEIFKIRHGKSIEYSLLKSILKEMGLEELKLNKVNEPGDTVKFELIVIFPEPSQ